VHPAQFPILGMIAAGDTVPRRQARMAAMTFEMTDQVLRLLTDDTLVWLTTVTPSGRPAPRLVWFMWLDGASDPSQDAARLAPTRSSCLIYSQPGAAKLRHIAVNDRVTLNFNSNELCCDRHDCGALHRYVHRRHAGDPRPRLDRLSLSLPPDPRLYTRTGRPLK